MANIAFLATSRAVPSGQGVTGGTNANNLGMVDAVGRHRCPVQGKLVVAVVTGVAAGDVSGGLAAGRHAIVTGDAIADESTVIYRIATNHRRLRG